MQEVVISRHLYLPFLMAPGPLRRQIRALRVVERAVEACSCFGLTTKAAMNSAANSEVHRDHGFGAGHFSDGLPACPFCRTSRSTLQRHCHQRKDSSPRRKAQSKTVGCPPEGDLVQWTGPAAPMRCSDAQSVGQDAQARAQVLAWSLRSASTNPRAQWTVD